MNNIHFLLSMTSRFQVLWKSKHEHSNIFICTVGVTHTVYIHVHVLTSSEVQNPTTSAYLLIYTSVICMHS